MKKIWFYKTKIGTMGIVEDGQGISAVFVGKRPPAPGEDMEETPLLMQAAKEVQEYLEGRRKEFQVKIHLEGTDFQKKVWEALCRIPYGETRSYKEIAQNIGNPKACRAVGMANNRNPIMILVPCHRVIGQNGSLTGYASGVEVKKRLLDLERSVRELTEGDAIRRTLEEMAEPEYQKFTSSLIPNISREKILGVRLPRLRSLAGKIAKSDWQTYLAQARDDSYEEIMLQGMVIGQVAAPLPKVLEYVREFLPKIDNWSTCDSFCAGLKQAKAHPEKIWYFLQPYFQAEEEYQIRFAVVMLLNYYVEEPYMEQALRLLENVRAEFYYVKMAVAWAISIFFIRFPGHVMTFLSNSALDDFTYNKALQKIIESQAVDDRVKAKIREMKRR